jgi:hypothetical protein
MGREGPSICDQSTIFSGLTLPLTASVEDFCDGACVHILKFITQAANKLGIFLTTIPRRMAEDRTVKGFFFSGEELDVPDKIIFINNLQALANPKVSCGEWFIESISNKLVRLQASTTVDSPSLTTRPKDGWIQSTSSSMILANIVDNCVTSSSTTSTVIRYCWKYWRNNPIGEPPFTICSTLEDPKGYISWTTKPSNCRIYLHREA